MQIHEHQTDGDIFDNTVPPQIVEGSADGDPEISEMVSSHWGTGISETFGDERGL